jgi:hypothetical protein
MREPSAHALIELLSSLDTESNLELIATVTNDVITPTFFLSKDGATHESADLSDRAQWMQILTPEQIAVALHLQTPRNDNIQYEYPLDEPLVTAESVPTLSAALGSTSSVVHPRCHIVWNALWMYLTEEAKNRGQRHLRSNDEFPSIVEKLVEHVVIDILLGRGEESTNPTNERRSLALQIVCALGGSSDLNISLPTNLIGSVLCPEVVVRVFLNVLCASGGLGKKNSKEGGVEHHLKPLTSQALVDLIDGCCENGNFDRRMAFAKALLLTDPRFDTKTKTQTVSSLLMLNSGAETEEESERQRAAIWQQYLSFLEEEIVSATTLHDATVYIELMYKLAKCDLARAPANEAKRVVRFFMSAAFFDCSGLVDPHATKKSSAKKKKSKKTKASIASPSQELSSGFRIKELLEAKGRSSLSLPAREIMSARFYSLLSDFISLITSQNRGGNKNKSFHGKGSRPESIYQALSEICGISSLLETSGAKKFQATSASLDADDASDSEDPIEASNKLILQVQNVANDSLVNECDGSGNEDILRAKAVFATGCASLIMSLHLQLNSCGNADGSDEGEKDDDDGDLVELVHEFISDLAECVDGFCRVIEGETLSFEKKDGEENPLATMAGLLVNILSSRVGGENSGKTSPIQASAAKLTRETVKLAWSGVISVITGLSVKNKSPKSLVDEDVMSILIESVCGEKSMGDGGTEEDDESMDGSDSSEDGLGESAIFVDASESGMDLENEVKDDRSVDSKEKSVSSEDSSSDDGDDDDVELEPTKLENLLLEDSDAELSDSGGILEHHAGADKALAQLIKMKQEARKASQTERERIELCNRLRCSSLLDISTSVFKSGWLPTEAVLGSIIPILRSYKAIAKSVQSSLSTGTKKSMSEKKALLDRLSALVKDKISKFRCSDSSTSEEIALKASSDIYEEMKHSLDSAHCAVCSVALITAVRCIPNVEDNAEVKSIYVGALDDRSSRKTTKIHACLFDDLIERMPR